MVVREAWLILGFWSVRWFVVNRFEVVFGVVFLGVWVIDIGVFGFLECSWFLSRGLVIGLVCFRYRCF